MPIETNGESVELPPGNGPWTLDHETAHADALGQIRRFRTSPAFWHETASAMPGGYFVSEHDLDESWAQWEKHPSGDELLYLLRGEIDMQLRCGSRRDQVRLTAGEYGIIPRDWWHTLTVLTPGRGLFITFGEGTVHEAFEY